MLEESLDVQIYFFTVTVALESTQFPGWSEAGPSFSPSDAFSSPEGLVQEPMAAVTDPGNRSEARVFLATVEASVCSLRAMKALHCHR